MQQTPYLIVGGTDVPVDSRSRPLLRVSTSTAAGPEAPATVTLAGELCLGTADWAERVISRWYEHVVHPEVHLDLSKVTFIDGRGLSLLISLQRLGDLGGHRLRLSSDQTSSCVDRLLALCHLTITDAALVGDASTTAER